MKPGPWFGSERTKRSLLFSIAATAVLLFSGSGHADQPVRLNVVGGLAGVSQFERFEKPFWEKRIESISKGLISAQVHAFDRSGLPGQEMLQLMRLGVVPFGTALLAEVAADEPELNAVDLPGLNPDIKALRRTVRALRQNIADLLKTRFDIELLAIYTYPAQVVFCSQQFAGLQDLADRRVRTSSVSQSEMMAGVGAVPVLIPFAEMVNAIRKGIVDCAITGTLSGNEIGLSAVTSYVSPMAVSWGLSLFGANSAVWQSLPAELRSVLKESLGELEGQIWDAAEQETEQGLACDIGKPSCTATHKGRMVLVPVRPEDDLERKKLLVQTVVPKWVERCGIGCATIWKEKLAPMLQTDMSSK